jgi:hypothetical protein
MKGKMTRGIDRMIGDFKIPVYNKLKHYNFYDVFETLTRLVFTVDHKKDFKLREERIE